MTPSHKGVHHMQLPIFRNEIIEIISCRHWTNTKNHWHSHT